MQGKEFKVRVATQVLKLTQRDCFARKEMSLNVFVHSVWRLRLRRDVHFTSHRYSTQNEMLHAVAHSYGRDVTSQNASDSSPSVRIKTTAYFFSPLR